MSLDGIHNFLFNNQKRRSLRIKEIAQADFTHMKIQAALSGWPPRRRLDWFNRGEYSCWKGTFSEKGGQPCLHRRSLLLTIANNPLGSGPLGVGLGPASHGPFILFLQRILLQSGEQKNLAACQVFSVSGEVRNQARSSCWFFFSCSLRRVRMLEWI